jgi:hypothetical protein
MVFTMNTGLMTSICATVSLINVSLSASLKSVIWSLDFKWSSSYFPTHSSMCRSTFWEVDVSLLANLSTYLSSPERSPNAFCQKSIHQLATRNPEFSSSPSQPRTRHGLHLGFFGTLGCVETVSESERLDRQFCFPFFPCAMISFISVIPGQTFFRLRIFRSR